MTRTGVLAACICASLFLAPTGASATTIQYLGLNKYDLVTISLNNPDGSVVWNGLNANAGEQSWKFVGTPPPGYDPTFYTYCVNAMNYLQNTEDVTIRSTDLLTVQGVPDAGKKAAWLFNTYAPVIHGSTGTNTEAAALQVAIWEALYDTSQDLAGGKFRMTNNAAVASKALQYLNALYTGPSGYRTASGTWLDTNLGQDQEVNSPVPEPGTLILCGLGLIGLRRVIRQRHQRKPAA